MHFICSPADGTLVLMMVIKDEGIADHWDPRQRDRCLALAHISHLWCIDQGFLSHSLISSTILPSQKRARNELDTVLDKS